MKLNDEQKTQHLDLLHKKYFFDIELSSNCNLSCSFCPREYINRQSRQMNEDIAEYLNNWLPENCNIMFAGMGEPLLYENIFELINTLSKNNRIIGITTNGQVINDNLINKLIGSKLDFLQISINELDIEKYKKISGDKSNENVFKFLDKITEKNIDNKIEVQFSFVSEDLSQKEIEKQKQFSKKHKATYFQKEIHNRGGFLNFKNYKNYNSCYIFSQITFINSDGDILYCCHDLPAKSKIGNIKTHSFSQILELKTDIIQTNRWLKKCEICNDNGRKQITK